ncbi:hypothetical protein B0H14DRAFT_2577068 [Mycena olivaceomarginata]|nr:hypothetical protein B0H14DRAFT_2577068 [Mycena olivaceomarginata]
MLQVLFGAGAVFILLALQATTSPRIARAESRRVPCGVLAWRGTGRHPWPVPLLCVRWSWTDRVIILSRLVVPRTPISDGQRPVIGIFAATAWCQSVSHPTTRAAGCGGSPQEDRRGRSSRRAGLLTIEPVHHSAFLEVPALQLQVIATSSSKLQDYVDLEGIWGRRRTRSDSPLACANIGAPTVADDVCLVFMICNDCTSPRLAPGLKAKTVLYYVPVQAPFGNTKRDFDSRNCRDKVHPGVYVPYFRRTFYGFHSATSPLAQSSTNYDLAVVDVELRAHLSICHGVNLHGVELAEHDWMCRHPMLPALRLCTSAAALHPHSVFVSTWRRECKALSVVVIGCTYLELDVSLHGPREKYASSMKRRNSKKRVSRPSPERKCRISEIDPKDRVKSYYSSPPPRWFSRLRAEACATWVPRAHDLQFSHSDNFLDPPPMLTKTLEAA